MPVAAQKLGDQVALLVARALIAGFKVEQYAVIAPTEQEISERYGVSKIVAREVTARLQSMGLTQVQHGKRMRVRPPTEWDYFNPLVIESIDADDVRRLVGELHDARLLIEPEAAARAAVMASADDVASMRASILAMEGLHGDPDCYLEHDVAFHSRLVLTSGNRVLAHIIDSISALSRASRRLTNQVPGGLDQATAAHRRLLDAIEAGDSDGARTAMLEHLLWPSHAYELPKSSPYVLSPRTSAPRSSL